MHREDECEEAGKGIRQRGRMGGGGGSGSPVAKLVCRRLSSQQLAVNMLASFFRYLCEGGVKACLSHIDKFLIRS